MRSRLTHDSEKLLSRRTFLASAASAAGVLGIVMAARRGPGGGDDSAPATDTPPGGRLIGNADDVELERRINALALNVRFPPYNAIGDAAADDRPALQSALDDCHAAGGGFVFLPPGTYLLKSGSLLLREGVNLVGAGMFRTTIKLGAGVNAPAISDDAARKADGYALGPVYLAHFQIDGNKAQNPNGQAGLFTSAYFSTFEQICIRDCRTHGLHMGLEELSNAASQNRVVGCRMTGCDGAGVYLDINATDHLIAENYIHDCDYGVVMRNGGVRVVDNDIYGNRRAGILVTQTSSGSLIANNDLNANRRHGIHITRTSDDANARWSQLLVTGNSILGDELEQDAVYDGIYVATGVPGGIAKLSIVGNKIYTLGGPNRFRYGVNLEANVADTACFGNHVQDALATYSVGADCAGIELDRTGWGEVAPPPIPARGAALANPFHAPMTVYISGGSVDAVEIGGRAAGLTSGSFRLLPRQTIALSYSVAPTWTWFAD